MSFNGSANWSPAALASDEATIRVKGAGTVARYNRWIDHLFTHPPRTPRRASRARAAVGAAVPFVPLEDRIQAD